jgi:membrane-bound lytic murein transglycosylase A
MGAIPERDVTMQSIRAWFQRHPNDTRDILWRNRSYIFFREAPVDNPDLGPVAAAKVPLTPLRSLAVDNTLHTFSTPVYLNVPRFPRGTLSRLTIAQDTGTAIRGAARGDFFTGSGEAAGDLAGVIRHDADFYMLVPRQLVLG